MWRRRGIRTPLVYLRTKYATWYSTKSRYLSFAGGYLTLCTSYSTYLGDGTDSFLVQLLVAGSLLPGILLRRAAAAAAATTIYYYYLP